MERTYAKRIIVIALSVLLIVGCIPYAGANNFGKAYAETVANYTVPTDVSARTGQSLSEISLTNPESNVAGTWDWMDADTYLNSPGQKTYLAKFTPEDSNYDVIENIAISVNVILDANISITTDYETLADVVIDWDTVSITWVDPTQAVGEPGEKIFKATATSSGEYEIASGEVIDVLVTVEKPEVPYQITDTGITVEYEKTLADIDMSSLNAQYGGTWTWVNPSTSVGSIGTRYAYANFAANENSQYSSSSSVKVYYTVVGKMPSYIIPTGLTAVYGTTLSKLSISNPSGSQSGSWSWMNPGDLVGAVGTNTHKAKFYPSSSYYRTVDNIDLEVTVTKKKPTCVAPTGVTAGLNQTLADVELTNPESNTAGTWEWMDGTQSVGDAVGEKTFTAKFTPDDSNYETITDIDVTVTVEQGTEAHPYIISTKEDLNNIRNNLSASYKLANDIVFTAADFAEGGAFYNDGKGWEPIGTSSAPFTGTFDGGGYVIKNLQSNQSTDYVGLFGYSQGTIKRVGLVNCVIRSSSYVAGICGYNRYNGSIDECYTSGNIDSSSYSGGIAGRNEGTVTNCYSAGMITGSYSGGIIGSNEYWNRTNNITNCYSIAKVSNFSCGSLIGKAKKNTKLSNSYSIDYNIDTVGYLPEDCAGDYSGKVESLENLRKQDTYAGFDFENVWTIAPDADYWLPTLRSVTNYAEAPKENTTDYAGGYGTYDSPYLITNVQQLDNIRKNLNASYRLENDITFQTSDFSKKGGAFFNEGKLWNPIGSFYGNFDGNGHCISGLLVARSDEDYCGLFSYNYGVIKNLQISNFDVTGDKYCGGIVGYNEGELYNCFNLDSIKVLSNTYGALCGENYGTISECFNAGDLTSEGSVGGIAYYNDSSGKIEKCYNSGNITSENSAGGIACSRYGGTITDCYNSGNIIAKDSASGIAYRSSDYGLFINCYNIGVVRSTSSNNREGNISGYDSETNIKDCYSLDTQDEHHNGYGNVCTISQMQKQSTYKGFDFETVWEFDENSDYKFPTLKGITSYAVAPTENTTDFEGGYGTKSKPYIIKTKTQLNNMRKEPTACFKLTDDISFTSADFAEGGEFYNDGKYWEPIGTSDDMFLGAFNGNGHTIDGLKVSRTGESYTGLFGYVAGNVKNLKLTSASIKGSGKVGGIVGYLDFGEISNCTVGGTVSVYGNDSSSDGYAGGIVGYVYGDYNDNATIENCVNKAKVVSDKGLSYAHIGGIVGHSYYAKINNSQNSGTIQCYGSYGYVGGISGECGTIDKCYNTGKIVGTANDDITVGGIVGEGRATITNSYNVGIVTSKGVAGGIVGCYGTVSNCYNAGNVSVISAGKSDESSNGYAGGIVGCRGYDIENCYNVGEVTSNRGNAGGIIGTTYSNSNYYVKQCYNVGNVSCESGNAGAIAGTSTITISDCYYLDNMSKGVGDGTDTATSCTSETMQNKATYNSETWDFDLYCIWDISDTADYKYPVLDEVANPELQYTLSTDSREGVPSAPTEASHGETKIEVKAVYGYLYACVCADDGTIPSTSSDSWKKANGLTVKFENLEVGKTYKIYSYKVASGSQSASYISEPLVITLLKTGDISGDGKIDLIDTLYMKRALAGWDGYKIDSSACDTNGDGKVDDADVMVLERYVAGVSGYEALPVTIEQ